MIKQSLLYPSIKLKWLTVEFCVGYSAQRIEYFVRQESGLVHHWLLYVVLNIVVLLVLYACMNFIPMTGYGCCVTCSTSC